ncbi:MAG TPA: FAD-dependent oxidoreductase [Anaerolineales bacterium]|nr:FAD-dependent oxidoreductase [Anaerolineales bacterium]
MTNPSAIIVGGGLSGMVIARELALRGWRVTLLERSRRLGGKAGSDLKNGRLVEHGYHVFPQWYPNVRAIVERIGVKLIDFDRYHFLLPGEYPRRVTVLGPSGFSAMWHYIFHGLLPWYHNLLYIYSVLDMLSRPLSEKRFLDRVSQIGLIRGRWYTSESVAEMGQENVLKASAIPVYDLSAMTAKRIASYWVRQASPFLSILPGDLQTVFIDPQVRELETLGVEIRYDSEVCEVVMHGGRVGAVALHDGTELSADVYALCTPFEVTRTWLHDHLYEVDPELGSMHLLEAQPMAALHLRVRKELPDLPREHVFFHGSHYALSFIDITPHWKELDGERSEHGAHQLSFISSNYSPLNAVSPEGAKNLLLEEICEYLPITPADVESWELNPNTGVPLFINTIGAWSNRPRAKTKIQNLYLAGDYVKNAIDLACMEGAVSAALEAAAHILRDHGETGSPPVVQVPPEWPRALLVFVRILMVPVVAMARVIAWIEEKLSPHRPYASEVRRRATPRLQMDSRPPRER